MKKEKSTRRKEQGEATKKRLYECARELFNDYGVENVSVDDIVEAAGVARGTFYVHFESKDGLISTLVSDYADKVDMDYEAFLKALPPDMSAQEVLLALVGKICDVIEQTLGYESVRTLYKAQLSSTPTAQDASGYNRALYQMLAAVLEKGISRGDFQASLPHDALSKHLVLAVRGLVYEWCIRYPDFDLKGQALKHFEILLKGIEVKGKEHN
ncbi:MAG TPA: TetR/AcrR family transcriptional regulator [Clostridia bacterium]|nr:TetR/AcrR family transcriptional regulator [Clostridia bacterium]